MLSGHEFTFADSDDDTSQNIIMLKVQNKTPPYITTY